IGVFRGLLMPNACSAMFSGRARLASNKAHPASLHAGYWVFVFRSRSLEPRLARTGLA
ncbi:hypothetical protein A2U01_0034449, partial [Trifolium medium]|nr:hypothetical protein [Trifolium medium]